MSYVELLLIGIGLSMDAFAVAVCKGLAMKRINMTYAFILALFFGAFQALMPLLGWLLASSFAHLVQPIGHWVAFALLLFVGAKMLWDAFHEDGEDDDTAVTIDIGELFALAVATSIDAFAVGVSFALLDVEILTSVAIIGCTTFLLSLGGVVIGNAFGSRWEKPAQVIGGLVLIALGFKALF